jgi:plasmid stabilization system protein ParE
MTVQRSERFDTDLERQFRWYLLETGLDPGDALALATRFAEAVEAAFEVLGRNPEVGRRRFGGYAELAGARSWRLGKPFHRFLIFYRIESGVLFAERLLEGHSQLAGGR